MFTTLAERVYFKDRVVHSLGDERGVDAEADTFLVSDGVGFHEADGVGKPENFDFRFEGFARNDAAILHIIRNGAEFLEEGFRTEENREAVSFDFRIVGIENAD